MKTTSKIKIGVVTAITAMATLTSSCKKDNKDAAPSYSAPDYGNAVIKLTATPPNSNYSMVNVEVKKIEVQYDDGNWAELTSQPQIFNVLKLNNDLTAILSSNSQLRYGNMTSIRLTMGYHNSVILKDAQGEHVYPLRLIDSDRTLVMDAKTNITKDAKSVVTLRFNTAASVQVEEQGTYIYKPTIDVKSIATE